MDKVKDFFKEIEGIVKYWGEVGKDKAHVADGVAFSILVMIDGGSKFEHKLDLLIDGESIYEMPGVFELHSHIAYHHMKKTKEEPNIKEGKDE